MLSIRWPARAPERLPPGGPSQRLLAERFVSGDLPGIRWERDCLPGSRWLRMRAAGNEVREGAEGRETGSMTWLDTGGRQLELELAVPTLVTAWARISRAWPGNLSGGV
jgi:hypothetical protein